MTEIYYDGKSVDVMDVHSCSDGEAFWIRFNFKNGGHLDTGVVKGEF